MESMPLPWFLAHAAPPGAAGDRLRLRLCQFELATLTILATAWLATLGPLVAIAAVLVAKHVLVGVVMAGLGGDADGADGGPGRSVPAEPAGVTP